MQKRPSTAERIRRLERRKIWIHRLGWLWLVAAFVLVMQRAQIPTMGYALADLAATVGPLVLGAFYSFFVIDGNICLLQMEALRSAPRHRALEQTDTNP